MTGSLCIYTKTSKVRKNEFLALYTYTYQKLPVYLKFNKKTRELGPKDLGYDFKAMCYIRVTDSVTADVGQPFHFNCFTSTSTDLLVAEALSFGLAKARKSTSFQHTSTKKKLWFPCEIILVVKIFDRENGINEHHLMCSGMTAWSTMWLPYSDP